MIVTLHMWMVVPAAITAFWTLVILNDNDRDMTGLRVILWLAMTVPALLVAWLK